MNKIPRDICVGEIHLQLCALVCVHVCVVCVGETWDTAITF